MTPVILDTGPLVAFLNRRDTWHDWAIDALSHVRPPLLSCEAVISEACFLLRHTDGGADAVLDLNARGLIDLSFRLEPVLEDVRRLMKRYADVPMSLADACLVRLAESTTRATVMTLDADFTRYRRLGRQRIPLISPRRG
jgi:predicted nucleic acid-binding protein